MYSESPNTSISRRNFLSGRWDNFRENPVEPAIEIGIASAVLGIVLQGARNRLSSYTPVADRSLSEKKEFVQIQTDLQQLSSLLAPLSPKVKALEDQWQDSFLEYECDWAWRPITKLNYEGDLKTTMEYKEECKFVWREPEGIAMDHEAIEAFGAFISNFSKNAQKVLEDSGDAYNLSGPPIRNVTFEESELGRNSAALLAFLSFGSLGYLFAKYEEIAERLAKSGIVKAYYREDVGVTRRSILKFISSIPLLVGLTKNQRSIAEDNSRLHQDLKKVAFRAHPDSFFTDADTVFKDLYGLEPKDLKEKVMRVISICEDALRQQDVFTDKDRAVLNSVNRVHLQASSTLMMLDELFATSEGGKMTIPRDALTGMRHIRGTRQIEEAVEKNNPKPILDIGKSALWSAGYLTAAAVVIESINQVLERRD